MPATRHRELFHTPSMTMNPHFFIRCDGKYIRLDTRTICYLEALKNYVRIVTTTRTYLVLLSLRQLEEELPPHLFCRVHRSFIVSVNHITSFDHQSVYIDTTIVPISPVYKTALQSRVRVLVSDTRSKVMVTSAPLL